MFLATISTRTQQGREYTERSFKAIKGCVSLACLAVFLETFTLCVFDKALTQHQAEMCLPSKQYWCIRTQIKNIINLTHDPLLLLQLKQHEHHQQIQPPYMQASGSDNTHASYSTTQLLTACWPNDVDRWDTCV